MLRSPAALPSNRPIGKRTRSLLAADMFLAAHPNWSVASIRLHFLRLPSRGTDVAGASARQHRQSATVAYSC